MPTLLYRVFLDSHRFCPRFEATIPITPKMLLESEKPGRNRKDMEKSWKIFHGKSAIGSGQIIATSAEVTLNGGLVRESPQNPLNSGLGIIQILAQEIILSSYIGITINYCKDPYSPTTIMEWHKGFDCCSGGLRFSE